MTEIRHVLLAYNLGFKSINDIITSGETARKVRDAGAAVEQYCWGSRIFVHIGNDELANSPVTGVKIHPNITVRIANGLSETPEDLERVVTQFISVAGPPSYVTKDSDLGLLGRVLEPLGLGLVNPPIYSVDRWFGYRRVAKQA